MYSSAYVRAQIIVPSCSGDSQQGPGIASDGMRSTMYYRHAWYSMPAAL